VSQPALTNQLKRIEESLGGAVFRRGPLAARDEIDLTALTEETWVLPPSDGMGGPDHLVDTCQGHGFSPRVRYRLVDNSLRRELIAAGRAVSPVQPILRTDGGIAARPIAGDPMWMRYHREYADGRVRIAVGESS
jgi:DNA-binding transcriptional LysR family regulator